ncbi:MAG: hypothetical protein KatS3mg002_0348 [Candidatus Woesearchaeota archaeon]|nr:MAG: hypothetical protein KatS3mg002_0348 [Candidatus Woesearchaeota archaeon]
MNHNDMQSFLQQMAANMDVNQLETIHCFCGANVWVHGMIAKKLSALQSPTGKTEILPFPVAFCMKCGRVFEPDVLIGNESNKEGGDEEVSGNSKIILP